jgi:hypothetical protein
MASLTPLLPVLEVTPVPDMAGVLQVMRNIEQLLAPREVATDGIAWFNRLYLAVTEAVFAAAEDGQFEHPEYVQRLDVTFANLYFSALVAFVRDERSPELPRAWWPVLAGHERTDVLPIQFALAGMNAHINRDLPVALTRLWRAESALSPSREQQRQDYQRVNQVLAAVEVEAKRWFLTGPWISADHALHGADDVIANFSVVEARGAAWAQGEALNELGGPESVFGGAYLEALDGVVGLAGRGLLLRTRVP